MVQVYEYNPYTYEYVGVVILQEDPMAPGFYLQPDNTTYYAPPIVNEPYKTILFNITTQIWVVVDDFRGLYYVDHNGNIKLIESLDFTLPEGCGIRFDTSIPLEPPNTYSIPDILQGVWIGWKIDLNKLKQFKYSYISTQFELAFSLGYFSQTIQKKINTSRNDKDNMESLLNYMKLRNLQVAPFRVYDNSIIYITQEQLSSMIVEILEYGLWLYQHKWELQQRVDNAQTPEEVLEIIW